MIQVTQCAGCGGGNCSIRETWLTHQLATIPVEEMRSLVPPDTVVVHLTTVPAKLLQRERLLAARNIKVEDIGHWTVQRGDVEFEIFVQHVLNAADLK